jgi:hypothetical protein
MVARAVQHHLVSISQNRPDLLPAPPDVEQVVGFAIGPNLTRIKVYMEDKSVRSFDLKLTERKS